MTTTAFQADGLAVNIPISDTGLTPEQAAASTDRGAWARSTSAGPVIAAVSVTVGPTAILADFGPGGLAPGVYQVQVRLTVEGRPATVASFAATVEASLSVAT
jgi:hypothetical protein